jgi:hypothetical protein
MKQIMVTLGGREFEIRPLSIKKSREWRQKLSGPFQDLAGTLQNADQIELTNPADVANLIELVKERLIDAPDLVFELVCEYAPAIAADRTWIEENANDEEAMEALIEVLKLAYPFGPLTRFFKRAG